MELTKSKLRFDTAGYYFIGLIGLVVLGFWPSYFAKFFNGKVDFTFYFHFHAAMVMLWIFSLIIQPILIRTKKIEWHRRIGKASYIVIPLVFLSIILLAHSRHPANEENLDIALFVPFKDLVILSVAYFIAIRYRHTVAIHARGMIVTGIVCIEPALARLSGRMVTDGLIAYLVTIGAVYFLLIFLMIKERNQKDGRWVFPLVLGLYVILHSILLFEIHVLPWEMFSKWFASLSLT